MIDIDKVDQICEWNEGDHGEEAYKIQAIVSKGDLLDIIASLREAEKDAARYRCIKVLAKVIECEEFDMDLLDGQDLDAMVDDCIEAMQCK